MPHEELQCLYTTANDVTKHFSMIVSRLRLTVITVGLLATTASGTLLIEKESPLLAAVVSFWGMLFVFTIAAMMKHYREHAVASADATARLEEQLVQVGKTCDGAWIAAGKSRLGHKQRPIVSTLYHYGTFAVMGLAFAFVFAYSLLVLISDAN